MIIESKTGLNESIRSINYMDAIEKDLMNSISSIDSIETIEKDLKSSIRSVDYMEVTKKKTANCLGKSNKANLMKSGQFAVVPKGTGSDSGRSIIFNASSSTAALLGTPPDSTLEKGLKEYQNEMQRPFESHFKPTEMRQLALVAHNHMKPAMKLFIETHAEILKKFRITGTNTTMSMCKAVFDEDDDSVVYGATCSSGPLGGDAQIAALMVLEDIGGIIFFVDPLSAHPHQADIDSLIRLANVGNIMLSTNPATAESLMHLLRCAMEKGKPEMFPSFFHTLESPSVPEYKAQQAAALQRVIDS